MPGYELGNEGWTPSGNTYNYLYNFVYNLK